ncbi:hypothetical protein ACFVWZ_25375 [Streptomyces sp. NPDC058200]|uniref:hypothetical protein n=1 Tax=Streptomyces sp. NPDC058200 TaxID=3346378 RepID=UPI0036EE0C84
MNTITGTHIQAADATVIVRSNAREVTDWARRYFGPWWNATDVPGQGIADAVTCTSERSPRLCNRPARTMPMSSSTPDNGEPQPMIGPR